MHSSHMDKNAHKDDGDDPDRQLRVEAFNPEPIGKVPCCRCDNNLREDIGCEHPLVAMDICAEGGLQTWNSNVDDSLIENAHEHSENHYQCNNPLVFQSCRSPYCL